MHVVALALFGLSLAGPPSLPDIDETPPADAPSEPPADAPSEPPADAPSEPPADAPSEPPADAPADAASEPPADTPSDAAPGAGTDGSADAPSDDAIEVTPPDDGGGAAAGGAAPTQTPSTPAPGVQQPSSGRANPGAPADSSAAPVEGPAEPPEQDQDEAEDQAEQEEQPKKKLGGFRLFRIGIAPKIGYTHGTSQKNGLFDREKSIQDSVDNMELTTSGAGDLGKTRFGGFAWGAIIDAEIVGINVWLDFHKFFRPGGMWSLLLGYDHEFGFGQRLRLDVGIAGGLNQVFLGKVLDNLYYDQNNPEAVNIGTLGVEGRGMVDLHIKIVGPLYTGPYAMVGYHYLWSASADEVTAEKGLHYSAGWSLRLDFAAPKLLGRKR